jgi:hypothetical protein
MISRILNHYLNLRTLVVIYLLDAVFSAVAIHFVIFFCIYFSSTICNLILYMLVYIFELHQDSLLLLNTIDCIPGKIFLYHDSLYRMSDNHLFTRIKLNEETFLYVFDIFNYFSLFSNFQLYFLSFVIFLALYIIFFFFFSTCFFVTNLCTFYTFSNFQICL